MSRLNNDWTGVTEIKHIYDDKCLTHLNALELLKKDENIAKNNFLLDMDRFLNYLHKEENSLKKSTVLVVGCSIGYQIWALNQRGYDAFGIDISEYAIENSMDEIKGKSIVKDIRDYNNISSYDNVIAFDVLEHIPDIEIEQSLINCKKATKKVFLARLPIQENMPFFNYDVTKIKSEHMISQSVEWWDKEISKVFNLKEFKKTIEKQAGTDWWIYRYEKINQ